MARNLFNMIYVLLFMAGGFVAITGILPFRMVMVVPLVLLLVPIYGLKWDPVLKMALALAILVIVSGIANNSSLKEILFFFRFVLTPFAMYYLVQIAVKVDNIQRILHYSLMLGMVQLPIIVVQKISYPFVINSLAIKVAEIDFSFGSFYYADDPALSLFLIGLVLFLLFDNKNNGFVKSKHLKAGWLTLTVLLANSVISHLLIVGIWGYFLLRRFNLRVLIRTAILGAAVIMVLMATRYWTVWVEVVRPAVASLDLEAAANNEQFFSGSYSRAAAILYYVDQPLKYVGDGPTRYYNPATKVYLLGNKGQLFTFYGEIGIIGLLLSYGLLFATTRVRYRPSKSIALYYFACVATLTITTSVMSDASIMLAYNIFLSTNLVSLNERRHQ